ncbi:MAG: hypothetical protein K0R59_191 [Sphingobacterium sp.]|jgi:hypothetical protein|nr:hypothetical protein [Sphingobacterium sp.]
MKDKKSDHVTVQVQNIISDSIGYRLIHFIEGGEVIDTILPIGRPLEVGQLKEDMYLLVLSWPRNLIPHRVFHSRDFDPKVEDRFTLTKAMYINPGESDRYIVGMDTAMSTEDIEINAGMKVVLKAGNCPSCQLAEQYWKNYDDFFARKDHLISKSNAAFYEAIEQQDRQAHERYLHTEQVKNNFKTDARFDRQLDSLVSKHPEDPVSTFFVFYQLYTDRDFARYQAIFRLLKGNATSSVYYPSLKNAYGEKK